MTGRGGVLLNDVQSQLNSTTVERVETPRALEELQTSVRRARREGRVVSVSGGRHAMGGHQFAADSVSIDTRGLDHVLGFDAERGVIEVEAGIQWPELVAYLQSNDPDSPRHWSIIQKQSTGDRFTLGGSLSANAHGPGLRLGPLVADVESFVLVDADGEARHCSRQHNRELFGLVAGGYGLFGILYSLKLRLRPRTKLECAVRLVDVAELVETFERLASEGHSDAYCRVSMDERSDDFLRRGILCSWKPVADGVPLSPRREPVSEARRREIFLLAHTDRRLAFERHHELLRGTAGVGWSDTHLLQSHIVGYHRWIDERLGSPHPATEAGGALLFPRRRFLSFLDAARPYLLKNQVELVMGNIRVTEKDEDSFLAWAKEPCIGLSYLQHTVHTPEGIEKAAAHARGLIDVAREYGGIVYLTNCRWPSRAQIDACYPEFGDFLRLKRKYDSDELFQSEWYRHYRGND